MLLACREIVFQLGIDFIFTVSPPFSVSIDFPSRQVLKTFQLIALVVIGIIVKTMH